MANDGIYCDHFGLSERPFLLPPDPSFLFWGSAHRSAFTVLDYGMMTHAPITLLTGEVGAGKTTLLQHMLGQMGGDVTVGLVSNARGERAGEGELLRWVLHAFGQRAEPGAGYVDLFQQVEAFLLAEYAAGRRVVLIFDEAQHLGRDALEELRMLTNINSHKDEILQLVLVGQPELRDTVRRPDLTQFAQRVSSSFHLSTLGAEDTERYIAHRIQVAGGRPGLFTPGACMLIHARTGGVPRLINQLSDLSLLYAFTEGLRGVPERIVRQVIEEGTFFGDVGGRRPLRLIDKVGGPEGEAAPAPAAPEFAAPEAGDAGDVVPLAPPAPATLSGKGA
jgi:type II secretory pathway predicted ATPase ExeA